MEGLDYEQRLQGLEETLSFHKFGSGVEHYFQLIFQVPSFVEQEMLPLSSEREMAMGVEGVSKLTSGVYKFPCDVLAEKPQHYTTASVCMWLPLSKAN